MTDEEDKLPLPELELELIHIELPKPMTFQEAFGIDPTKVRIKWSDIKHKKV